VHRTLKPQVQVQFQLRTIFFFLMPPFHVHFSLCHNVYSSISTCIDTIQVQNKMLTIWLLDQDYIYCRLLSGFICPLQPIEEVKKSAAFPLINSLASAGLNPSLEQHFFFSFCRHFAAHFFSLCRTFAGHFFLLADLFLLHMFAC